ncbi:MAG: FHA domain-containing protein [Anaerolineae bacterium]
MAREGALIVKRGASGTTEWTIDDELVIGRDPGCDIALTDRQVSRLHARIVRDESGYRVVDAGSKNGTWVNGLEVVGAHRLTDGDEITVAARVKLYFVDAEATAPLTFEDRGLRIDPETLTVYVRGVALDPPLSGPQWELVRVLAEAEGAVVTRDEIVERVWPDVHSGGVSEDALDALVRRVRRRIAEEDRDHSYIVTVRGYGFRLDSV